jgi:sec-independent protein translocase protein TatA
MLGSLGMPEILVIAVVLMIIFGPRQLPKLGRSMGETIREWKKAGKEIQSIHNDGDDQA